MELIVHHYAVDGLEQVRTPALLVYPEYVRHNIGTTIRLLGRPDRWRPHLKTAKLAWTMRELVAAGVKQAKCATPLELETACAAGFDDVLVAYPVVGPAVALIRGIADRYPAVRISALVEAPGMVEPWRGSRVGLFIDLNPGMNRTGMALDAGCVAGLARAIERGAGPLEWRGLHYYDGTASGPAVTAGYAGLLALVRALEAEQLRAREIITAGTPAFPAALGYSDLFDAGYLHRLSPGTLVYCDARSLDELPRNAAYAAAVLVLSRVVSRPGPGRITCDAGHKTVSADAGDPTCSVLQHADWTPRHPSEEHLPIDLPDGVALPEHGSPLYLLPRHVCPTVNNFTEAVLVAGGKIAGIEPVTARGRHPPTN